MKKIASKMATWLPSTGAVIGGTKVKLESYCLLHSFSQRS